MIRRRGTAGKGKTRIIADIEGTGRTAKTKIIKRMGTLKLIGGRMNTRRAWTTTKKGRTKR